MEIVVRSERGFIIFPLKYEQSFYRMTEKEHKINHRNLKESRRISCSPHLLQHLLFVEFLMMAIITPRLRGVKLTLLVGMGKGEMKLMHRISCLGDSVEVAIHWNGKRASLLDKLSLVVPPNPSQPPTIFRCRYNLFSSDHLSDSIKMQIRSLTLQFELFRQLSLGLTFKLLVRVPKPP